MLFRVNGFYIANLQKAKDDKLVTVDIIANHLTEDQDKEVVLKEAFDDDTVKEFLDIGVIEFWHESKNELLTKKEKNDNLIGRPVAFRWENGLPVVTATLSKTHPIVQSMMPHLESNNPVYAASIGGSKVVLEARDNSGKIHKIIPKIRWDHLAIAPQNMVVNREPGVNVKMLEKAKGIYNFSNFTTLAKALEAPGSVDALYSTPGGAITKQSLEKSITPQGFSESEAQLLLETILSYANGNMPTDKPSYFALFPNNEEFAEKSYRLFDTYFKKENS